MRLAPLQQVTKLHRSEDMLVGAAAQHFSPAEGESAEDFTRRLRRLRHPAPPGQGPAMVRAQTIVILGLAGALWAGGCAGDDDDDSATGAASTNASTAGSATTGASTTGASATASTASTASTTGASATTSAGTDPATSDPSGDPGGDPTGPETDTDTGEPEGLLCDGFELAAVDWSLPDFGAVDEVLDDMFHDSSTGCLDDQTLSFSLLDLVGDARPDL